MQVSVRPPTVNDVEAMEVRWTLGTRSERQRLAQAGTAISGARALGFPWPPEGLTDQSYVDDAGRVDLDRLLEVQAYVARSASAEAAAGRSLAAQAMNVSRLDYEDFRDSTQEAQSRAERALAAIKLAQQVRSRTAPR